MVRKLNSGYAARFYGNPLANFLQQNSLLPRYTFPRKFDQKGKILALSEHKRISLIDKGGP